MLDMMNKIKEERPGLAIDFVDVFCEKGVYSVEQSRKILNHGKDLFNCQIGFHGDELSALGGAELAADIGARSISHLEFISSEGIKSISSSKTAAVICPTTAYLLRLQNPPVRHMIESDVIVALGSDFNPNAFCYSMAMVMNLAIVNCRMTLNEALIASTINSAYAINKSKSHGSLEVGKVCDAVLLSCKDWKRIVYQLGEAKDIIKNVIKKGKIVI